MIERKNISQQIYIYSLGALVGAIAGLAAVLFRFLITGISYVFVTIPQAVGIIGWVIVPAIGGLIVAFIVIRYAPETKGHGIPEVMESYVLQGGKMRPRVPVLKTITSAISIGTGGSCGREGPIAQIGAGVGSVISERLHLGKNDTKTLVLCGLTSGLAATFNTPLGGALFGVEVIAGGVLGFSILPIILSCVVATAVASFTTKLILGHAANLAFYAPSYVLNNPLELVFFLILGITMGLVSIIWMRGFFFIESLFEKVRTSKYLLPAIGGISTGILGIIVIYLEQVFHYSGEFQDQPYFPAVMGDEYPFINSVLLTPNILSGGVALLGVMFLFGLIKIISTGTTLGSGGSGGVFAPTLFIGAGFGGALGWVFAFIVPSIVQPTTAIVFALVGMAALFGGSCRAPITGIIIIVEMSGDYLLILPLMISVSAAYLVSSFYESESIYTMKLARRGVHISRGTHIGALKSITVGEIMTKKPTTLRPDMKTSEVFRIIDSTHHTKFPVVEEENKVVGILIAEDLFKAPKNENGEENQVKDLMNSNFLHLTTSCTMDGALQEMIKRDEGHAVVVDSSRPDVMIGYITKADVLKAYEIAIMRLQTSGMDVEDITPADIVKMPG